MKKTRIIDLFQTIKKTKTTWIAIVIFFFTSISIYFGFNWSDDMLVNSFQQEFINYNTRDIELISFYGITEENLDLIRNINEVEDVEKINFTYGNIKHNETQYLVNIRELSENIDKLNLLEGKFPEKADEVVIDIGWAERNDISIGDTLSIITDTPYNNVLTDTNVSICGFVSNPAYSCSVAGTYGNDIVTGNDIDVMLYCRKELFSDNYSFQSILITGENLKDYRFDTSVYGDKCEELADSILSVVNRIDKDKHFKINKLLGILNLEEISFTKSVIQTKSALLKLVSLNIMTDIMTKASFCLSLMFFIVALLVCYVAINRILHLQATLIGMKKSFGFTEYEIVMSYVNYTVSALFIGYILGVLFGFLFEHLLANRVASIYYISEMTIYYNVFNFVIIFAILLAIIIVITVRTVIKISLKDASDLLNEKDNYIFKKEWFEKLSSWKKISLFKRSIIKNLTTNKRRVIGTIISICCCMALFVCGITFYCNVRFSIYTQFKNYFHFDTRIEFDSTEEDALNNIQDTLDQNGLRYIPVFIKAVSIEGKDHKYSRGIILVIDEEKNSDFFTLKDYEKKDSILSFDGIYVGHAFRSFYGKDCGSINLYSANGNKIQLSPNGYFINYLLAEVIIMSKESYREYFNEEPYFNNFFVQSGETSIEDIKSKLVNIQGFLSCENYIDECSQEFQTFVILVTSVSIIFIVVAIIMSFLVLKNILSTFILSKKKEIIIMIINGYEDKDARKYILYDTILLTVISLIPGAIIGSIAGYYAICSFDSPTISLLKDIFPMSWVVGILFTLILSLVNYNHAINKIENFDITDLSK